MFGKLLSLLANARIRITFLVIMIRLAFDLWVARHPVAAARVSWLVRNAPKVWRVLRAVWTALEEAGLSLPF